MSVINTNVMSLNSQRNLSTNSASLATTIQRLSSGLRINSAKDDAAGLAISERFTTQIRGINQAARNANDGISLAQTAEGALGEIGNNLQRIRELAVQSSNATNSGADRAALQKEVDQLKSEIDRVATQTNFNGTKLLDGSFSAQQFQVGANKGETISVDQIASARTSGLGQYQGFTLANNSIGTANDTAAAQTVTVGGTIYQLGTIATDAKAMAAAINSKGPAGMTASANETVKAAGTSAITATANGTSTFTLNGVQISLAGSGAAATNRATALEAINNQSAATGVRAVDTGSGLELRAADGRNVTVAGFAAGGNTGATLADWGLGAAGTAGGTLNVSYSAPTGTTGNVAFSNTGLGTNAIAATGSAVSTIDITSSAGAQNALVSLDAALQGINASRADLGAIQNRFTSVVSNLNTTSENLTASRSRIRDADYAKETAELSRTQILSQAGTAMLAQANQATQGVLSLLR
ncbi:flagellin [Lysobacter korlensis]|uniref:Flagellin n=1 Tax=Lysobacter korlensis TaxID=553636 RepID=A0ABV6RJX0_9GAMM